MRIALIDGEHYPDVLRWALKQLGDVCCAVFQGGTEKIGNLMEVKQKLGIKIYSNPSDYLTALYLPFRRIPRLMR